MAWTVTYIKEAEKDLLKLDRTQQIVAIKAINKVAINPLSIYEGGYGKPLCNNEQSRLAGYYKIKIKKRGIRIVYGLIKEDEVMKVIVISVRDNYKAYKIAEKRL